MNPPEAIRVEPPAPYACGYRIEGADISRGLNAETFAVIEQALTHSCRGRACQQALKQWCSR